VGREIAYLVLLAVLAAGSLAAASDASCDNAGSWEAADAASVTSAGCDWTMDVAMGKALGVVCLYPSLSCCNAVVGKFEGVSVNAAGLAVRKCSAVETLYCSIGIAGLDLEGQNAYLKM